MSSYDNQYNLEESLFGEPYPEFVALIDSIDHKGDALDLGCGQGRDALMLAQQGYSVTGVDASEVGIRQMVERASALGLSVTGVVGDFHAFDFPQQYDLAVLDSILHFAEDKEKEIDLLDRVLAHTRKDGYVCIFIHKDAAKERALHGYIETRRAGWRLAHTQDIDYVYEEKRINFRAAFQMHMAVMQKA
ncbi:MAG: class I SAM-dependent methyltransferase [Caldilineaceae bacterium]|nr:class I SAM-dependent methyltransferase [Caldilineaceae bacterium]